MLKALCSRIVVTFAIITNFCAMAQANPIPVTKPVRFESAVTYGLDAWAQAVAVCDLDNDHRNDVLICTESYGSTTNSKSLFVFQQTSTGTLAAPVRYPALYDSNSLA